ncbi:MAG: DUF4159 domain-containing protein [Acidobacteriota bacterium]
MLSKLLVAVMVIGAAWATAAPPALDDSPAGAPAPSRFYFARVEFNFSAYMRGGYGLRNQPPWFHDYPNSDANLLKIVAETTRIHTTPDSYRIVNLESPDIMNYPWLYMCEVGFWDATDREVENMRNYLDRGGFIVVDDFRGPRDWNNFVTHMRRVYPDRNLELLKIDHPIFQCFYDIETLDMVPPYDAWLKPQFYGLTDDKGRLQMVVNFNNDIGDYWEFSADRFVPIELTNEAFKYGVNYVIYALTH